MALARSPHYLTDLPLATLLHSVLGLGLAQPSDRCSAQAQSLRRAKHSALVGVVLFRLTQSRANRQRLLRQRVIPE